jgi:hypothetical protein
VCGVVVSTVLARGGVGGTRAGAQVGHAMDCRLRCRIVD